MAHHQVARMYHKTSLLLPDGRILLSGSGANFEGPNEQSYELFSPPYLHKGPRPSIVSAPSIVRHGQPFTVDTPDADRIASVSFVRMGSETHSVDQDQRFMSLNFTRGAGRLTVEGPPTRTWRHPAGTWSSWSIGRGCPRSPRSSRCRCRPVM